MAVSLVSYRRASRFLALPNCLIPAAQTQPVSGRKRHITRMETKINTVIKLRIRPWMEALSDLTVSDLLRVSAKGPF
jgi:hypothetical protein